MTIRRRRTSTKRRSPTLRRGTYHSLSLDAATLQRITWARHVAANILDLRVSAGGIMRAACACYARHLERTLWDPQDPHAARWEELQLLRAMDGDDLGLTDEQITTVPVRHLREIVDEHRRSEPTPYDRMCTQLEAWKRGEDVEVNLD